MSPIETGEPLAAYTVTPMTGWSLWFVARNRLDTVNRPGLLDLYSETYRPSDRERHAEEQDDDKNCA